MLWSAEEASRRGFAVEPNQKGLWLDWALTKQRSPRDDGKPIGSQNLEGLSQLILGSRRAPVAQGEAKVFNQFRDFLLEGQQAENGLWRPMGQSSSQKRPLEETAAVSSMWALLALESFRAGETDETVLASLDSARDRALTGLQQYDRGLSTEWWMLKRLVAERLQQPREKARFTKALLSRQNSDGGWAWINGDPSDALATGLALYGLANDLAEPEILPAIHRAQRFLVDTQQEDGSWHVLTTKAKNKAEAIPTSIFLGSAWATIGLLKILHPPEMAGTAIP